jgi:hypothetical protein
MENDFISLEVIMENKSAQQKCKTRRMTFGELIELEKKGKLVVQPKYQRDFFWSKENQEDYIKNVLYGGYPSIFTFYVPPAGVYEVIDGHQRITTLLNHVKSCPDYILSRIGIYQFIYVAVVEAVYEERQIIFCDLNGQTALSRKLREKLRRARNIDY